MESRVFKTLPSKCGNSLGNKLVVLVSVSLLLFEADYKERHLALYYGCSLSLSHVSRVFIFTTVEFLLNNVIKIMYFILLCKVTKVLF